MDTEHDESEVIDWQLGRDLERITSGAASHHRAKQPDEEAMEHEEGGSSPAEVRDALREELFAYTCDYTLGAGLHPEKIREKIEAMMRRFDPETLMRMRGSKRWWDEKMLMEMLDRYEGKVDSPQYGMLFEVSRKIKEEQDERFVYQSYRGLCGYWTMDGYEWRKAVCAHLVMVKALRPGLIGGMSLDDIAVICGDKGKATVSARAKRLISKRLEAMGMRATYAHYQKSAEAVESYRAAQMGNTNRRRKQA